MFPLATVGSIVSVQNDRLHVSAIQLVLQSFIHLRSLPEVGWSTMVPVGPTGEAFRTLLKFMGCLTGLVESTAKLPLPCVQISEATESSNKFVYLGKLIQLQ